MKEVRLFNEELVRRYCIDNQLYTQGDCEAYEFLLYGLCSQEATPENIITVARNIADHSNTTEKCDEYCMSSAEYFEMLVEDLINDCCRTYVHL